tara:strand:+ start:506 stop:850 length:345 start_codon:yes stop_codon:yes gene_type:complete
MKPDVSRLQLEQPTLDLDGYPTEGSLKAIRAWDVTEGSTRELVEYVRSLWRWPDYGFKLHDKQVKRLRLSTGGWSGNEEVVAALRSNYVFWGTAWEKSVRGGHHWFQIPKLIWR